MALAKYRLKGHESFILREGWITKALFAIDRDPLLFTVSAGADALAVGTNMAKSIRFWMRTAGLTDESQATGVHLTELGRTILQCDPYLEDIFTLWIIHINIATNYKLATSWNVFFNRLSVSAFKREELQPLMTDLLYESTGEDELPERSIKDDCAAIILMYAVEKEEAKDPEEKKNSPFRVLGMLYPEGRTYEKRHPDLETLSPLVVEYMLATAFGSQNGEHHSLGIDEIVDGENMPGRILNLSRIMVNDCLDKLQDQEYIIINRTAGLDMVYEKCVIDPEAVVRAYYEGRAE